MNQATTILTCSDSEPSSASYSSPRTAAVQQQINFFAERIRAYLEVLSAAPERQGATLQLRVIAGLDLESDFPGLEGYEQYDFEWQPDTDLLTHIAPCDLPWLSWVSVEISWQVQRRYPLDTNLPMKKDRQS